MASSGRPQSPAVRFQQTDQISDLHLSHHNATDSLVSRNGGALLKEAAQNRTRFVITKSGKPTAVLLSISDFDDGEIQI